MKHITIAILLTHAFTLHAVNRPEEVPSKITELRAKSWYSNLSMAWQTYLSENQQDVTGWIQYFRALEYAGHEDELINVYHQVKELNPGSFLESYFKFKVEGWTETGIGSLEKAISLDHPKQLTLEDRLIHAEVRGSDRQKLAEQVFNKGLIHPSTLNYNYNLLMSVEDDGILVTDALHSSIPLWVLQDVMNVREDVSVLNLQLIQENGSYFDGKVKAIQAQFQSPEELFTHDKVPGIYYAITLPRETLQQIENRLYVVGLASTQGSEGFQHFDHLRENIEEKFLLDYLSIDFNGEPKTATGKVLSSNYIVPMLLLKEFYDEVKNEERSSEVKETILRLANDSQMKARVQLLLNSDKAEPRNFKVTELDTKKWEKKMKQVKDNLYAADAEITVRDYWSFLDYLRTNGYDDLFEIARQDLSSYDDLTANLLSNFYYTPENLQFQQKHEKHGVLKHPAIDIPYEGAKAYCEWLTVRYNAQEGRKYKNVVFRLPTEEEWKMAALGYKDFQSWTFDQNTVIAHERFNKKAAASYDLMEHEVDYPWALRDWSKRTSITNHHNCYLANIGAPEEITCPAGIKGDGFTLTSPVGTYFPNDIGLFDVIGNVAEMIDDEGKAMGGSWRQPAEECTLHSILEYDGSDVRVGARPFMEVIEE